MNVPLIQKPETNDINASLIAIRKQLQILNESVNNIESKYLLKSELKELSADTVGGDGKYIESISENNGIINAVEKSLGNMTPVDTVTLNNTHSVTSGAVAEAIQSAKKWKLIDERMGAGRLLIDFSAYSELMLVYNIAPQENVYIVTQVLPVEYILGHLGSYSCGYGGVLNIATPYGYRGSATFDTTGVNFWQSLYDNYDFSSQTMFSVYGR